MKSTIVTRTTETSRSRMLGLLTHPTLIVSLVLVFVRCFRKRLAFGVRSHSQPAIRYRGSCNG